jgi:hypothetical protein
MGAGAPPIDRYPSGPGFSMQKMKFLPKSPPIPGNYTRALPVGTCVRAVQSVAVCKPNYPSLPRYARSLTTTVRKNVYEHKEHSTPKLLERHPHAVLEQICGMLFFREMFKKTLGKVANRYKRKRCFQHPAVLLHEGLGKALLVRHRSCPLSVIVNSAASIPHRLLHGGSGSSGDTLVEEYLLSQSGHLCQIGRDIHLVASGRRT